MFRKIVDGFGATHVTAIAVAAILAPCALYAVPAFQNVSILNANTGYRASVDMNGRLFTVSPLTDPLIAYSNTPANYVSFFANSQGTSCSMVYTPPTGKALIITSATSYTFGDGSVSGSNGQAVLARDSSCMDFVAAGVGAATNDTKTQYFGVQGVPVPANTSLYFEGYGGFPSMQVTGYLVPAPAVPAQTATQSAMKTFAQRKAARRQ